MISTSIIVLVDRSFRAFDDLIAVFGESVKNDIGILNDLGIYNTNTNGKMYFGRIFR